MKKKAKTIQFQINDPCHESWNKMHSLPGGRFCDSCEKTVVDFSEMTDNEVVRFVQKNNQKLCGRFRPEQLNREMAIPRTPSAFQKWKSAAAIFAGLLSWNAVEAQHVANDLNAPIIEKVENKEKKNKKKLTSSNNILKGIVKAKNGEPLIGATVLLEAGKGTITDIDGKFELEIPKDWESFEVTFSYIGYGTQVIEFDLKEMMEEKVAEVKMKTNSATLTEVEIIGQKPGLLKRDVMGGMISIVGELVNVGYTKGEKEKEEDLKIEISNIYPNPFVNFVNVKLQVEKESPYLFHLYNANGQLIWAKTYDLTKGDQELRLDFSLINMAQGTHFLRVTDGSHEIQTKKIIKVNEKGEQSINSAILK